MEGKSLVGRWLSAVSKGIVRRSKAIKPHLIWGFIVGAFGFAAAIEGLWHDRPALRWAGIGIGVIVLVLLGARAAGSLYERRTRRRTEYQALRDVLSEIVKDDRHPFEEELK